MFPACRADVLRVTGLRVELASREAFPRVGPVRSVTYAQPALRRAASQSASPNDWRGTECSRWKNFAGRARPCPAWHGQVEVGGPGALERAEQVGVLRVRLRPGARRG